jgi:hypothetical protein
MRRGLFYRSQCNYEGNPVIDNVLLPYLLFETLLNTPKPYHLRPFILSVILKTTMSVYAS